MTHYTNPPVSLLSWKIWIARAVAIAALGVVNWANAAPPVPINAMASGTFSGGGANFFLNGSGIGSHLGSLQYSGNVVITSAPGDVPIADTLTETFTAANGDTITILCQQIAIPDPQNPNVLQGSDQWTVIGGTGRFAGATGSGTGTTYVTFTTSTSGTFIKQLTGTITPR